MVSGWIKIIGTPKELKYTQLGNINATKLSDRKKKHMEVQKWTSLSHIFLYFILVSCSEIPFESFYMKTKSLWSHIIREVLETWSKFHIYIYIHNHLIFTYPTNHQQTFWPNHPETFHPYGENTLHLPPWKKKQIRPWEPLTWGATMSSSATKPRYATHGSCGWRHVPWPLAA